MSSVKNKAYNCSQDIRRLQSLFAINSRCSHDEAKSNNYH